MDPNPENFVGAGIIQTKALQVGCLLRLEPNAQAQVSDGGPHCAPHIPCTQPSFLCLSLDFRLRRPDFSDPLLGLPHLMAAISTQMYRLTLRTSKEPVSRHLCELLAQQF